MKLIISDGETRLPPPDNTPEADALKAVVSATFELDHELETYATFRNSSASLKAPTTILYATL